MLIGVKATADFFFQKKKWKGTLMFFVGIFLVLYGWTIIGMGIEIFGFINLFGYGLALMILLSDQIVTLFQRL